MKLPQTGISSRAISTPPYNSRFVIGVVPIEGIEGNDGRLIIEKATWLNDEQPYHIQYKNETLDPAYPTLVVLGETGVMETISEALESVPAFLRQKNGAVVTTTTPKNTGALISIYRQLLLK